MDQPAPAAELASEADQPSEAAELAAESASEGSALRSEPVHGVVQDVGVCSVGERVTLGGDGTGGIAASPGGLSCDNPIDPIVFCD